MKKILIISVLKSFILTSLLSQNVQLFYNIESLSRSNKADSPPHYGLKITMNRSDEFGSTFIQSKNAIQDQNIVSSTIRISRELRFWKPLWSVQLQFYGGTSSKSSINSSYSAGVSYQHWSNNKNGMFLANLSYKRVIHSLDQLQLYSFWNLKIINGLCETTGIAFANSETTNWKSIRLQAEPQFWFNLNKIKCIPENLGLSIGMQFELMYSSDTGKYDVMPALGLKWRFGT